MFTLPYLNDVEQWKTTVHIQLEVVYTISVIYCANRRVESPILFLVVVLSYLSKNTAVLDSTIHRSSVSHRSIPCASALQLLRLFAFPFCAFNISVFLSFKLAWEYASPSLQSLSSSLEMRASDGSKQYRTTSTRYANSATEQMTMYLWRLMQQSKSEDLIALLLS